MANAHLAPVRRRNTGPAAPVTGPSLAPAGRPKRAETMTIAEAVEALIRSRGWTRSTAANCRQYMLGSRMRDYLAGHGVTHVAQLTADHAEEFLALYREAGAEPATLTKARLYFRALAKWADDHGMAGLGGVEKIPAPRLASKLPVALSDAEVRTILAACESPRDRVLVETLLATGLRVSELVALRIEDLHLTERPPFAVVSGSAHNPRRTKSGEDRVVPLVGVAGRLERYISRDRPTSPHSEVFLQSRTDRTGIHRPLAIFGVERIMTRLKAATGVHCNPHKLRHTFATRAVNDGLPIFHLQQALGHRSVEMVRRYYSADRRQMLESFARAYRG